MEAAKTGLGGYLDRPHIAFKMNRCHKHDKIPLFSSIVLILLFTGALSERCAPGVGALVGAPLRVAGRSAGRSAAPDSSPERYPERRSEFFRSANALIYGYQLPYYSFVGWEKRG